MYGRQSSRSLQNLQQAFSRESAYASLGMPLRHGFCQRIGREGHIGKRRLEGCCCIRQLEVVAAKLYTPHQTAAQLEVKLYLAAALYASLAHHLGAG